MSGMPRSRSETVASTPRSAALANSDSRRKGGGAASLVMVEALACGMPVVATPCGAAREIVADGLTGFLRPELDDLVTCIERAGMISPLACRARVEEHFSAETMVDRYLHLFHALLGDRTDG